MKKSILTLAVIAGLTSTAAYADGTTLYGTVKVRAEYVRAKLGNVNVSDAHIKHDSEFGIKGTESLGGGLSAFYDINVNIDSTNNNKVGANGDKAYVGLKGGFGSISLGTQNGIYEWAGDTVGGFEGSSDATDQFFGPGDLSNSVAYVSPSFGGVKFGLAAVVNGDINNGYGTADKKVDAYQVAVAYNNYGVNAALAYHQTQGDVKAKYAALALGYTADAFSVDFGIEKELTKDSGKQLAIGLAGTYNISDSDNIHMGIGYGKDKDLSTNKEESLKSKSIGIGYTHKFSKRTKTWIEYVYADQEILGLDDKLKTNALQLGLSTSF